MYVGRKIVVRLRNHICHYNATMPFSLHCWRTNDAVSNVIKYWESCHGKTATLSPYSCATHDTHWYVHVKCRKILSVFEQMWSSTNVPTRQTLQRNPSSWEPRRYTRMYGEKDKRTDRHTGGMDKPKLMGAFHEHDNAPENGSNE